MYTNSYCGMGSRRRGAVMMVESAVPYFDSPIGNHKCCTIEFFVQQNETGDTTEGEGAAHTSELN